jgi:hypothetical protein
MITHGGDKKMTKRLEILKASLIKKEALFDVKLQNHIDTVRMANGQPLNDKRNGRATLNKWEKQNDSLRTLKESIQKTKDAIDIEKGKIIDVEAVILPVYIQKAIDDGLITQWRKFPRFFFVVGVEGGRIVLDEKTGTITYRYLNKIPKEQFGTFRDVFNKLNQEMRDSK